jgi:hypothetical protein
MFGGIQHAGSGQRSTIPLRKRHRWIEPPISSKLLLEVTASTASSGGAHICRRRDVQPRDPNVIAITDQPPP